MCSPTLMISAASNGLKFMQAQKQNKSNREQAMMQNERATQNRILKETSENFKIRQKRKEAMSKAYAMRIKSRDARSKTFTASENMGGGVIDKLINNYFRQEGEYKSKVLSNLQDEAFQSMRAKEAYRLGEEYNKKYIPAVETLPNFASASLNFASDYYSWRDSEEQKKLAKDQASFYRRF
jgi:hypothetical protein